MGLEVFGSFGWIVLVWHLTYFEGSTQKKKTKKQKNNKKTKKKQKNKKTKKQKNKKKKEAKKKKCVCLIFVTHLGLRDLLFP